MTTDLPAPDLTRNLPLGDVLALGAQLRADLSPDVLLQDVVNAIVRVLGISRVYVRLRNPDTDVLEACAFAGLDAETTARLSASPVAPARYQALLQPDALVSESYLVDSDPDQAFVGGEPPQHGPQTLLVPLRGSGERLTGVIYIDVAHIDLDTASIQILEAIARQAALALENARLATSMQRLLSKEQLLTSLGRRVSATLDLDAITRLIVERLCQAFSQVVLLLLDDDGVLQIAASAGVDTGTTPQYYCAAGQWTSSQGLPFLSNELASDARLEADAGKPLADGGPVAGALMAVPLRSGGRIIGALCASSPRDKSLTYEDVDLLEAVAAQIGGPISGAQLYQQTQRLAEQIRRRNEHLLVINTLASMAVSSHDLDRVLSAVTDQIHQGFGYGHVELYEIDDAEQQAVLVATASHFEQGTVGYRQPLDRGIIGRSFVQAKTILVDDVHADPDYVANRVFDGQSELCVPIVASNHVLAILNLESSHRAAFSSDDIAALETAADVLAGAIENARLSRRAQELAVLEERSRLARDLHDSVSQQLFSMTLTAQAARAQLEKNPQRTATQLERLQETAQAALAEMRALIFQLRPPGLSEMGLVGALQQYVASVNKREDINVYLSIEGEERNARGAEQAIYRIVQEALNNIVKHAGTCDVMIELVLGNELLKLIVRDNGCGFDLRKSAGSRHLGLISMRERAAELDGTLELETAQGQGTTITVIVPRPDLG